MSSDTWMGAFAATVGAPESGLRLILGQMSGELNLPHVLFRL